MLGTLLLTWAPHSCGGAALEHQKLGGHDGVESGLPPASCGGASGDGAPPGTGHLWGRGRWAASVQSRHKSPSLTRQT